MKKRTDDNKNPTETVQWSPVLTPEQRKKMGGNIKQIALRAAALNPVYPLCMASVLDFVERGELTLAVEFFFQEISNPEDMLVDVRLHDLMYMMHASYQLGSHHYRLKDFQFMDKAVELYD